MPFSMRGERTLTTERTTGVPGLSYRCAVQRSARSDCDHAVRRSRCSQSSLQSLGHSVAGQDLRALVLGATVGGFADVVPGLYYQSQFSYGVDEKVLDIRTNRTRADSEVGYFVTPRLALRLLAGFQLTHDGLDKIYTRDPASYPPFFRIHSRPAVIAALSAGDPLTGEINKNHDRLLRSNFLSLGGGLAFRVTDTLDIFAAASKMVWMRNVHPLRALSVGANWHFRTRGVRP